MGGFLDPFLGLVGIKPPKGRGGELPSQFALLASDGEDCDSLVVISLKCKINTAFLYFLFIEKIVRYLGAQNRALHIPINTHTFSLLGLHTEKVVTIG